MNRIFPPSGGKNAKRFAAVGEEERSYMWFCLEFCDDILASRPEHLSALEIAANHYTALGYYEDGLKLDRRLAALKPNDPGILYNLSCSLALVGKKDDALAKLGKAIANGYHDYRHMTTDCDLQFLHEEPRFKELVALATTLSKERNF